MARFSKLAVLLISFCLVVASSPAYAQEQPTVQISARQWEGSAGSHAAGVFCLPNGSYDAADFLHLIPDVQEKIKKNLMLIEKQDQFKSAEFSIIKVNMKLCAKKYGVLAGGRNKAMTGYALFNTVLKITDFSGKTVSRIPCEFKFEDYKKKPESVNVIFIDGVVAAFRHCIDLR